MKNLSTTTRLSIGLACSTITLLLVAQWCKVVPDPSRQQLASRTKLCESMTIHFTSALENDQMTTIQTAAPWIVQKNPDILSMAVYKSDGQILVETEGHRTRWKDKQESELGATHVKIPLVKDGRKWGIFQICFRPIVSRGIYGYLMSPWVRLSLFLSFGGIPIYWLYLRRTLRHLDPSKVIPGRVKAVLDTLSEGVLVLDNKEQIILANDAFTKVTGRSVSELQGRKASEIDWLPPRSDKAPENYPWEQAILNGDNQKGVPLTLRSQSNKERTFIINSSPIRGTDGKPRGALATFNDISEIEEKNEELERTLDMLRESRDKIKEQNDELKLLSMRDPLTDCLNRRAFYERFEAEWSSTLRYGHPLSCIMIDIDYFKKINDKHGHAAGDEVLQRIALVLKSNIRKSNSVCRYGGEEFCVLLTHANMNQATQAAEKIRNCIENTFPLNISVTASLGVAACEHGASSPQELVDQADKALYAAKHGGRNQVIRWDQIPDDLETYKSEPGISAAEDPEARVCIPYAAVTALISALEYRDLATAEHSRTVADLSVAMAKGIMSVHDCYILEIGALLHDIGKIGVPDEILLKPGPLSDEEWEVMDTHDQMGVDIIKASFGSAELTHIVRNSHAWYGGCPRHKELPTGQDIPLRSRIVLIADSYDAMTSERPYRQTLTQEEAFSELRRYAGSQFDPGLVERFIEIVLARDENRSTTSLSTNQAKALRIGLELEKLACAMESQDISLLTATTERLITNATFLGLPEIAEGASKLQQTARSKVDLKTLIEQTTELLELCRSQQSSYLSSPDFSQELKSSS
jgi:diguanylate cyclase (GGDEF)-like protein/PAS domain S-box-containing protein